MVDGFIIVITTGLKRIRNSITAFDHVASSTTGRFLVCIALMLCWVNICAAGESKVVDSAPVSKLALKDTAVAKASLEKQDANEATTKTKVCGDDHIEYWLISSRHLPCFGQTLDEVNGPGLTVHIRDNKTNEWKKVAMSDFQAATKMVCSTWIMIHGNRFTSSQAPDFGWQITQSLAACGCTNVPQRVVIWSWPSDPVHGIITDVRVKSWRTPTESIYLSWFLRQIPGETPICFFGHSFGSRITTGALHLIGGGSLAGYAIPKSAVKSLKYTSLRGVLMASAIDCGWLMPNQMHGQALNVTEKILFINNSCDPLLKHYRVIDKCTRPEAIGYVGALVAAEHVNKVEQIDASGYIGKTHESADFIASQNLLGAMCRFTVLENATPASNNSKDAKSVSQPTVAP